MIRTIFIFISLCTLTGCAEKYHAYVKHYEFRDKSNVPEYKKLDYWAAHPWKTDPSDSLPGPLISDKNDSLADVFFIHPTTYTDSRQGWNADINDAYLNAKTDYSSILYQASVFNKHCRIFAPRYRQVHLSTFFINDEQSKAALDTAYADVQKAFVFYLAYHNNNRPIIVAGHSQGALMAERLLDEFFDGKPLQEKLVVAYIIGWPAPENTFERIKVCKDSVETNCFCGWRTYKVDYVPDYVKKEKIKSQVTNPLSWTTNSEYIDPKYNKGAVLRDFTKIIKNTTDAQIHEGVLWVNKPGFPGSIFYRSKNYHIGDINLFYMNMRENIEQRILYYYKNHSLKT